MSVTFWIPDAPTHTVWEECCVCEGTGHDDGEPCYYCQGKGGEPVRQSTLPELNMANGNAAAFLADMGFETDDLCGTWTLYELPTIKTKLQIMLMATGVALEKEPEQIGRIIECGRDREYIECRIQQLMAVVTAAMNNNYSVSWG